MDNASEPTSSIAIVLLSFSIEAGRGCTTMVVTMWNEANL